MTTEKPPHLRLKFQSPRAVESSQRPFRKTTTEELHRRLEYVRACIARPSDSQGLKFTISEVACRRKEFPAPSVTTVCRWVHLYRVNGAPESNGRPLFSPGKERALRFQMIYED